MIRQTIFSISDSESNKMMTGELFEIKDNVLRVISLDGHRISIRKMELKNEVSDKKLIVPGKTLIEISKILSGEVESLVNISYTNNHIVFEFDNTIVVSVSSRENTSRSTRCCPVIMRPNLDQQERASHCDHGTR